MASKAQLAQLLDLPDEQLQQVIDYAATLSKTEAVEHFTNLLGESPQVVSFISTFNSRRTDPKAPASAPATAPSSTPSSDVDAVPKSRRGAKKKKAPLHMSAPRAVTSFSPAPGGIVYSKKNQEEDYISGRSATSTPGASGGPSKPPPRTHSPAAPAPVQQQQPPAKGSRGIGTLVSDLGVPKQKPMSNPVSRTSTPGPSSTRGSGPVAKINITGGTPMHGSSTALTDFDQAIRSLEITTNPIHASNTPEATAARRCNCVGARHPVLDAAPNCLSCGKVICLKEGLGPCTFCGEPLLSSAEVQSMIKELKAERGRERMAVDREAHKRPEVGGTPKPFANRRVGGNADLSAAEARALEHRDRLLSFQAQNARRTTVRDEASDFDPALASSMWATPEERALALKKQQKLMRDMEWNAKPEYEKRQQVVSIDLVGKKVFKKMAKTERPPTPTADEDDIDGLGDVSLQQGSDRSKIGGAFSKNPLLAGLIRPVYEPKEKGVELEGRKDRASRWRRVQDDRDDNADIILDGGIYGGGSSRSELTSAGDEPECG